MDLATLRKMYAMEIAEFRWQRRQQFETEADEIKSLSLMHMDRQLLDAVNEYVDTCGNNDEFVIMATTLLVRLINEIHDKEPDKVLCQRAWDFALNKS